MENLKIHHFILPVRKYFFTAIAVLLTTQIYSQGHHKMDIYKYKDPDSPSSDSAYINDIINYISDTLLFGGGKISGIKYKGNTKGVGLFKSGESIGFPNGIILSNGWVKTTTLVNAGYNRNGYQALPAHDSLGPYFDPEGWELPPPGFLQDDDMDYVAGMFSGTFPRPDTAVDPSVITFKFKPYYKTLHLQYVFASEEYKWLPSPFVVDVPQDPVDFTGSTKSDFMAIMVKRLPGDMKYINVASVFGNDGTPPWLPVSVYTLNHRTVHPAGYYVPNYPEVFPQKTFIFDGATIPMDIFPFQLYDSLSPCKNYWVKIGVADYPNGRNVTSEIYTGSLSYQINSAVFLKAYSLMSGYGLEWTINGTADNPDFANDTSLVEGGCSNLILTVKFNVMSKDTIFIRMKIGNADLSEYTVTPPLIQDSLLMIPDSVTEYSFIISANDDGIGEGMNGNEKWFIRYQMDPCDIPMVDSTGIGQFNAGYTGLIKVNVMDYNPFINKSKIYGPDLPPPAEQYHCGGDVTVDILDILEGGIPPYHYVWSNPPQISNTEQFTTTLKESPDYAYCTILDRCSGKPGFLAGKDTVIIYSKLDIQVVPKAFQLCQNGHTIIKIANTNVGRNFTTQWYFLGNLVGSDSIYDVTWAEYGQYAPDEIDFICKVTDYCGNTTNDTVVASFFPVVAIQGEPLICLYDEIHLTCSPAQAYQWYYNSYPGTPILDETFQDLYYTPAEPGNRYETICVNILNECGEYADTCFTFWIDELLLDMTLDTSATDFSVCPNMPFTLEESSGNAEGGWEWSWTDNGPQTALGNPISLSLNEAGDHDVQVIAYNINGCYDTIIHTVTVFPYSEVQAFTDPESVCIDFPATLSATTGPVTIDNYIWTADPPDASLSGQENNASPVVTPQDTTTYQCKIQDNNGCWDSTTVMVNVRARLDVKIFANPDTSCTDKPVQLEFTPIVAPLTGANYIWTFDDGMPATSELSYPPQVIWSNAGLKHITLHISELGCDSTFSFNYMVNYDPRALFSAINPFGCGSVEVAFNNESTNLENPSYFWEFGDGSTNSVENPTHFYENIGQYDVTLTVTNTTGCVNTLTVFDMVNVYEVPVADFTANPQSATIFDPTIYFNENISIPYSIIEWDFGDSTYASGDSNPKHTYGEVGNYFVIMYTKTEDGCWDRDTLEVGIFSDIEIFIPNAFSPNNDGLNDCFSIGGTTSEIINVFKIAIYSRWGNCIYESTIIDADCIWDGKDLNGNIVTADAYVYLIFGKNDQNLDKVYEGIIMVVK